MTYELMEEAIKNLFNSAFDEELKREAMSKMERERQYELIKKYHPKYYCEGWANPIQSFTLATDLGWL